MAEDRSRAVATIVGAMNWVYDRSVGGVPGFDSATELADGYRTGRTDDEAIRDLIRWQIAKAGTLGFVSNLGGLFTLPVAIPANLASVLFLQLRLVAAIAHLRGHDIRSDQVKTVALACLAGSTAADLLKDFGVGLSTRVSSATIARVNQAVGTRLVARTGAAQASNLSRLVPLLGGVVGGTIDGLATLAVGAAAMRLFRPQPAPVE